MHARRRRQRHFGESGGVVAKEGELVERDRDAPGELAGHERRREGELCALFIVKGKAGLRYSKTFDALDEPAPIRAAAKLAVADDAEPNLLLQPDGVADRGILGGNEAGLVQVAGRKGAKRLAQRRWAQQAADVVGAKRRTMHARPYRVRTCL